MYYREVYFLTHNAGGTRMEISLNTAKNAHLSYKSVNPKLSEVVTTLSFVLLEGH